MRFLTKILVIVSIVFSIASIAVTKNNVMADTTDKTYNRIKERGYMILGTSPDYAPYEFQTNINGKSKDVGMDIEVAKDIAKDLGVKLKIKNMSFDSLLVGLQTGKVDIVLSGINPSPERRKSVDFSDIYYKGGQSIIINKKDDKLYKDKNSFNHQTVAAQTGSIQYNLAKKQIKGAKVHGIEKGTDLILALQTNKAAGIVMEKPTAEAYVANNKGLKVIDAKFNLNSDLTSTAVAMPKDSPVLKQSINKTIKKIKSKNLIPAYLKQAGTYLKGNTVNTSMWHYWKYFGLGVLYTILLSFLGVIFGVLIGTVFALLRLSKFKAFRLLSASYVEFVRGTPLMVQLMFVYFGLGLWINLSALVAGVIAISLNSAAYIAEVIRGGINSVDDGQKEAAKSLGLSAHDQMRFVILPQALKNIWPALGNEFISLIKESSIVSIIGVTDLIYQLKIVQSDTYRGVAPIFVAMVLYFIMTFSLSQLLKFYERKFA